MGHVSLVIGKQGGKKKQAAGVQHLNVNNLFFDGCPAFMESETC